MDRIQLGLKITDKEADEIVTFLKTLEGNLLKLPLNFIIFIF